MPRSSEGGDKPHPYLDVCCIAALCRGWVYPSPTNSGQDTKQIPRSSEGGDKPHPYVGCVLQMSYYQRFAEKLGMVSGFCHFPSRMSEPALCSGVAV